MNPRLEMAGVNANPESARLVTRVDRKSRYPLISYVESRDSAAVTQGMIHSLIPS